MKRIFIQLFIVVIGIVLCIISINSIKNYFYSKYINKETKINLVYNDLFDMDNNYNEIDYTTSEITTSTTTTTTTMTTTIPTTTTTNKEVLKNNINTIQNQEIVDDGSIIYDNLTLTELIDKLNKNLNSTLSNTGIYFAKYYQNTGLDPYLAVAIVLHETGCYWNCSKLVTENYNIGGLKGTNGYMKFNTLEEGINGFLDILYNEYYSQGLTTAELINPKYASSTTWSEKINNYIEKIKTS